jgi:hypothetical protein
MLRLPKALSLEKSILEIQGHWLNVLTGNGPEALLSQLLDGPNNYKDTKP